MQYYNKWLYGVEVRSDDIIRTYKRSHRVRNEGAEQNKCDWCSSKKDRRERQVGRSEQEKVRGSQSVGGGGGGSDGGSDGDGAGAGGDGDDSRQRRWRRRRRRWRRRRRQRRRPRVLTDDQRRRCPCVRKKGPLFYTRTVFVSSITDSSLLVFLIFFYVIAPRRHSVTSDISTWPIASFDATAPGMHIIELPTRTYTNITYIHCFTYATNTNKYIDVGRCFHGRIYALQHRRQTRKWSLFTFAFLHLIDRGAVLLSFILY